MSNKYRVEMEGISKNFGGVTALKNVDFKVGEGEIHALVGENGAGKSTLVKILSGVHSPDSGSIKIDGEQVKINNPQTGKKLGVSIIYQEFSLVPELTVAENIFLEKFRNDNIIKWNEINQKASELIKKVGFELDVTRKAKSLSVAYQQVVEICKALSKDAKILILDEPTAVLSPEEINILFEILKELKQSGVAVIYISHRLNEIFEIADKATVLKDGRVSGYVEVSDVEEKDIVSLMVGHEIEAMFPEREIKTGDKIFEAKNLKNQNIQNVSFEVKKGEIFGIAGLVGNGKTEVAKALFGVDSLKEGQILLRGNEVEISSPQKALKYGIGMLPENRKEEGIILPFTVKENATMTVMNKISNISFIDREKEQNIVNQLVKNINIITPDINTPVYNLSGGNQQKVAVSKWFASDCEIIILDEPSRGIDVGAKKDMYKLIYELADKGLGIIFISSEIPEIVGMCDKVMVMYRGKPVEILSKNEISEKNIMQLATGGKL